MEQFGGAIDFFFFFKLDIFIMGRGGGEGNNK